MAGISGIRCVLKRDYHIFYMDNLSDTLKKTLRSQLVAICYGGLFMDLMYKRYSYKNTVKEFIKRYEDKDNNKKKGLIGELLVHLLITEFFPDFETVTPFFNMEERSVKKGYDIVLTEKNRASVWLIEVKSGELHKNKNSDSTIIELIDNAKRDLKKRLNEENQSLWQEAINGARLAYKSSNDMKEVVVDILENYGDEASEGVFKSEDKNIFVSSVLFADLKDCVCETTISLKQKRLKKDNVFNQIFILAVQKGTYQKVYEFLRNEADET